MSGVLLFVVNNPAFFLSHRLRVALAAKRDGFEVHVASPEGDAVETILRHGLIHHSLSMSRSGTNPMRELAVIWQLYRLFRRLRPSIVHLVTLKPVIYGGIAARCAHVPGVVVAISGLGFVFIRTDLRGRWLRRLIAVCYRFALGHANLRVIFQNMNDYQIIADMAHLRSEQTVLIRGSGVELDKYVSSPLPAGQPVVMLAARLLVDKGVVEFVAAARLLRDRGVSARFVLVGETDPGNPSAVSPEVLNGWQQEGVVECWGFRADMPEILQMAYMVVLPSYREGLPKVLIEAQACARPVVTTDVPGCRDAIISGVTGLLVPARSSVQLGVAIERLLAQREIAQDMGGAGRKHAENTFDIKIVESAHLGIYRSLFPLP